VRGQSVIHRLDPRVRLLLSVSLFLMSLVVRSIFMLSATLFVIIATTLLARTAKRFFKSMSFAAVLSAIAFVFNFFLYPEPFHSAVILAVRLFAIIGATSIFFLTTTPDELELVMRWFRFPSDFVMVFVIAVRFVPILILDALQIMDAQRSRGLELEKGNFVKRLRNTTPVIVPLLATAVSRSLDLAEAMDSRAYGATTRPTSLHKMTMKRSDWLTTALIVVGILIGFYFNSFFTIF
jgi:energy-coupling factor transport system permease protein